MFGGWIYRKVREKAVVLNAHHLNSWDLKRDST